MKPTGFPITPTLGIVVALASEGRCLSGRGRWRRIGGRPLLRSRLADQTPMMALLSGMGCDNALSAARWLISQGTAALVSLGISGGLDLSLQTGDLVIADRLLGIGRHGANGPWHAHPAAVSHALEILSGENALVRRGTILTCTCPVISVTQKICLHQRFAALAVDMESASVSQAAAEAGIPFFALRAVCDPAIQSIPPQVSAVLNSSGAVRYLSLILAVIQKPALMADLVRLARQYRAALQILQTTWKTLARSGFAAYLTRLEHNPSTPAFHRTEKGGYGEACGCLDR